MFLGRKGILWGLVVATMALVTVEWLVSTRQFQQPLPILRQTGDFRLTNQLSQAVTAADLRGKVTVVDVVFSRCPAQCHRLSLLLQGIHDQLPRGTQVVSLTADPDYDTPPVLAKWAARYHAEAPQWQFLTGTKAAVYNYAIHELLFTVLENPDPKHAALEDLFVHSTDFALLDQQGRLRGVVHGEDPDAGKQIIAQVRRLLKEEKP